MEKSVSKVPEFRQYYISKFKFFDGDEFIPFKIIGINAIRNSIAIAVSDRSIIDFKLMADKYANLFFALVIFSM